MAATFSMLMPVLAVPMIAGVAPASRSCAHGHTASGWLPYQSKTPTGTVPSARIASWSL